MLYKKTFSLVFISVLMVLLATGCNENKNQSVKIDRNASLESGMIDGLVYTNHLISDIEMEFFWEFSKEEQELYIILESPGSGWMAVGFDPTNMMADADIIIAGFVNETFTLEEHYGVAITSHSKIDETYIKISTGERSDDLSRIELVIPLGEDSRYDLRQGEVHTIMLSYHNSSDNFFQRHTQRTKIEVEL